MSKPPGKVIVLSSAGEINNISSSQVERISLRRGESLCLVPFRSLSIQPFSYPFSNLSQIREALSIKIRPYSVEGKGVEIFPAVFAKEGRSSRGVAWFIGSDELGKIESGLPQTSRNRLNWPVPMAFASRVEGSGVVVWTDGESICSMLFNEYFPALYRWRAYSDGGLEKERDWMFGYSRSTGKETENSYLIDSRQEEYSNELCLSLDRTLKAFPRYSQINVSRKVMDSFLLTERITGLTGRFLIWFLVCGILFTGGAFIQYRLHDWKLEALQSRSSEIYRTVFDPTGKIIDPLSQARARLADIAGNDKGLSLESVLSRIGEVWSDLEKGEILLNTLRYNSDYVDMSGTASEMISVQKLQKSLDTEKIQSRIGDIQQIPGGGIRFNMTLRW